MFSKSAKRMSISVHLKQGNKSNVQTPDKVSTVNVQQEFEASSQVAHMENMGTGSSHATDTIIRPEHTHYGVGKPCRVCPTRRTEQQASQLVWRNGSLLNCRQCAPEASYEETLCQPKP
ncbi:hypothetical protein TNCV_4657941 [Trichonephila clavipes]|nr:hypothetical protein TNCV_4657941 [Trichonephila clavipes]